MTENCKFEFTLQHIGINAADDKEAMAIAGLISGLFGLPYKEGNSSIFSGDCVEIMRTPFRGERGHIAFGVDSVEETEAYFADKGHPFVQETVKMDNDGRIKAVYLDGEIGGFAIHLIKKDK